MQRVPQAFELIHDTGVAVFISLLLSGDPFLWQLRNFNDPQSVAAIAQAIVQDYGTSEAQHAQSRMDAAQQALRAANLEQAKQVHRLVNDQQYTCFMHDAWVRASGDCRVVHDQPLLSLIAISSRFCPSRGLFVHFEWLPGLRFLFADATLQSQRPARLLHKGSATVSAAKRRREHLHRSESASAADLMRERLHQL